MTSPATALSVRETILQAAAKAPAGRIDDPVYLDTNLCLFLASDDRRAQKVIADVPVDRVVALGRDDFWRPGDTWRSVASRLTCKGWTEDVYDYFEAPLLENAFPADHALYEMRLTCMGGLCQVGNGNHRLVGGRAWLTGKFGNTAHWKRAQVQYEPLTPSAREMLSRAAEAKTGLRVALFVHPYKVLIVNGEVVRRLAALSSEPSHVYAMGTEKPRLLSAPWHFRLHRQFAWTFWGKLSWREIPHDLVVRMLDDGWITSQLPAPV